MGTVGLSFGSPTSGTGFNVSQTVSEIVANLQNVETPWKTQLTSLESQDAALSSLGTLFSNLSNDVTALTDFQGVLSLKTGSSSDSNTVDITSASPTAQTGTYAVTVTSLATTANGYLAPIASASDALTGSLAITTASGTTTIDVPATGSGNDNLQGLANAITAAGIGVNASVLTDANGSRLVLSSATSGSGGSLSVASSVADASGTLGYTNQLPTGVNAVLTVNGVALSSASNTVSNLIPGVTLQLLGTSTDDVQVTIANDNPAVESTMNQFVADFNSVISAINGQEGTDASGNAEPLFGSPTLSTLQQELLSSINYQNPSGYLDSVASASDTLTGSITVNGTAVSVPAAGSGTDNLAGLAAAINSSSAGVTANVVNNGTGPQLVLVPDTVGATLTVTSAITDSTSGKSLAYTNTGAGVSGLTSLGISMNNDGTISINETDLDSALNTNYSGVLAFFQNANSWGMTFNTVLSNAGTSNPVGVLKLAENSNSSIESSLNAQIAREDLVISSQQTSLTNELNSANEILQELPSQLQGVNEMYSAISGYNENSNG
jgi:flagellar hook-associated protein 2